MQNRHKFSIKNWALWEVSDSVEFSGMQAVRTGQPELRGIKPLVKRRMPPLARSIHELDCDNEPMPAVYASKNGELSRTIKLIRQFGGDLSPALFSMSVNNAIPGLLSVINKDKSPYTVVDSMSGVIEMAVLEAMMMLNNHPAVRIIYFEEPTADDFFDKVDRPDLGLVMMLVIESGTAFTLSIDPNSSQEMKYHSSNQNIKDYLSLFSGDQDSVIHDNGRISWKWKRSCSR